MTETLYTLPVIEKLSPALSLRRQDELDLIVIDHPQVRGAIALQGAHLLSFIPVGQGDVLWLSDCTPFRKGIALRGGVPLCWPWFGPGETPDLPSHGFARNLPWSFIAHAEDANGVVLTFELKHNEDTLRLWPHAFTLLARFRLNHRCEIELESHGDFETSAALHSYFAVTDIQQVSVSGLGHRYLDKLQNGAEAVLASGEQHFPDRTDRIYLEPDACSVIHDTRRPRTLHITHHHSHNVVAWNPGPALSHTMADVPDDGYQTFVCVETACITTRQKVSETSPGRLGQTIHIAAPTI